MRPDEIRGVVIRFAFDNQKLYSACAQVFEAIPAAELLPSQSDTRCLVMNLLAQLLEKRQFASLPACQDEASFLCFRIEGRGRPQKALHTRHDHVHGRSDFIRFCGRYEPLTGTDKQLVIEEFTEVGQRMAHRRRAPAQPLGSLGDTGIEQQGIQDDQQVRVEFFQVHGMHL